jgi:hypothetical protein
MVLDLSFSGVQGDLMKLVGLAVATESLNLCPLQKLHAKGDAGFFKGSHQLAAVVNLTVLLKQQPCLPAGI